MKIITKYRSARGIDFDTPEEAMAHEDALPRIIATYENDIKAKFVVGKTFAGKVLNEEDVAENIELWTASLALFKAKWAEVQEQRKQS